MLLVAAGLGLTAFMGDPGAKAAAGASQAAITAAAEAKRTVSGQAALARALRYPFFRGVS